MITPNRLTFFRLILGLGLPALLFWKRSFPSEWIVFFGFTVACITDWWDGYLARKKAMSTSTGKIADPIADKILILGMLITFCLFKLYSFWWIVLIVLREVVVTSVRFVYLSRGKTLAAEWAGKIKVGFQIASIYFSLVLLMLIDSRVFSAEVITVWRILHYLAIFLANVTTVISGVLFFRGLLRK